jgi:hypothetical protein
MIVSLTSCPYAPTFWIGVAPVEPGMPERHSMPAHPLSTAMATNASHGSPAATRTVAYSSSLSTVMPRRSMCTTRPSKPSSSISTLLPPARISTRC